MARTIVITGAGVGLGRALARRFADEGDRVVLLGRTVSKVEAAATEIGEAAMPVECDVADPASVRAAFGKIAETHAKVDILINNAAVFEPFKVVDASDEQVLQTIAINLGGPILCARSALPMMERGGHIINVTSESVELPFPHLSLYQASKAGLERFSKSLQQELDEDGIRVTTVRAGQMMEEGKSWDVDPDAAMAFAGAAMKAGLNLRERPISQFASVTDMFVAIVDLPADLHAHLVTLHARHGGE